MFLLLVQVYRILKCLPILRVSGCVSGEDIETVNHKSIDLKLLPSQEYTLNVSLERLNPHMDKRAYAPK